MKYNQSGQSNYEIIYLEKEYFSIRSVKLHEKKRRRRKHSSTPSKKNAHSQENSVGNKLSLLENGIKSDEEAGYRRRYRYRWVKNPSVKA